MCVYNSCPKPIEFVNCYFGSGSSFGCFFVDVKMAIDIESCTKANEDVNPNLIPYSTLESDYSKKVVDDSCIMNHGDKVGTENVHLVIEMDQKIDGVVVRDSVEKKLEKEKEKDKRKSLSAKKPPKPPRPPRELPLDAADQKLVKEIAKLALIKRARVERMKALKKSRAAKASNSSSSSGGSYLAILLTFVFCIVLVCHGFSSKIKSSAGLGGSFLSTGGSDNRFILAEDHMGISSSREYSTSPSGSLNSAEPALGFDAENLTKGATS